MLDDLDRPLGQDRQPPPGKGGGGSRLGVVALALVAIGAGGFLLASRIRAPGGEPEAVAPIQPPPPPPVLPATPPPAPPAATDGVTTAEQVETESGVKVFRGNGGAPGALIIQVPDSAGSAALAPAPDRRLVEKSRFGLLPRRGKDGATPAEVYARPLPSRPQSSRERRGSRSSSAAWA